MEAKRVMIFQGKYVDNIYIHPLFPVNDENVKKMLESGIAVETTYKTARWGSGIYEKQNDKWVSVSSRYDTSG